MKRHTEYLDESRLEMLETFIWKALHGPSAAAVFDLINEVKELRADNEALRLQLEECLPKTKKTECGAV